jgi:hypothetical protein
MVRSVGKANSLSHAGRFAGRPNRYHESDSRAKGKHLPSAIAVRTATPYVDRSRITWAVRCLFRRRQPSFAYERWPGTSQGKRA